jgi:hypothetical protein
VLFSLKNYGPGSHISDALPVFIKRNDHDAHHEIEKAIHERKYIPYQRPAKATGIQIRAQNLNFHNPFTRGFSVRTLKIAVQEKADKRPADT